MKTQSSILIFVLLAVSVASADLLEVTTKLGQFDQVSSSNESPQCRLNLDPEAAIVDFADDSGKVEQLVFSNNDVVVSKSLGWTVLTLKEQKTKKQSLRLLQRGNSLHLSAVQIELGISKVWSCNIGLQKLVKTLAFYDRDPTWGEWLKDNSSALLVGAFAGMPRVDSIQRSSPYYRYSMP
jgi:hypothetical protein